MIASINTAAVSVHGTGINITIEAEVADSGIGIHLVGMADSAVKECLLRVVTALQYNGYSIPGKRIVINVRPACVRMAMPGSCLDLPIAVALLVASGQIKVKDTARLESTTFFGELGLQGEIRDYGHSGNAVAHVAFSHMTTDRPLLITSLATGIQACTFTAVKTLCFDTLSDVVRFLEGEIDGKKQYVYNTQEFKNLVEYAKESVLIDNGFSVKPKK